MADIYFKFDYIYFLPLLIGLWRWSAYIILKVIPSLLYRAKPVTDEVPEGFIPVSTDMITMVIPVYMPEPGFIECVESWILNRPKCINIVVDTTSYHKVCEMMDQLDYHGVIINVIDEPKPGKRAAMYTGLGFVDTEIIVFADDDALYCEGLLRSLLEPFKDPKMGGVGTKQVCRPKVDGVWLLSDIMMDMRLYQRYLENKATTFAGNGCCSCVSGRTMAFRTALFQTDDFHEKFMNEHFFNALQLSGDDKCLTRMCINSDYKLYHQITEECTLSTQFESGMTLMKQILRWSRNSWRSDLKLLFAERKVWRKSPWLAFVLIDKMISPFTMIYGPVVITYLFVKERNLFIILGFLCYVLIGRTFKSLFYFFDRPKRPLKWVLHIPLFIIAQYIGAFVKIYALCTLQNRKWGNRNIQCGSNGIVRTGDEAIQAEQMEMQRENQGNDIV